MHILSLLQLHTTSPTGVPVEYKRHTKQGNDDADRPNDMRALSKK
jgi:hypothetical protein